MANFVECVAVVVGDYDGRILQFVKVEYLRLVLVGVIVVVEGGQFCGGVLFVMHRYDLHMVDTNARKMFDLLLLLV